MTQVSLKKGGLAKAVLLFPNVIRVGIMMQTSGRV